MLKVIVYLVLVSGVLLAGDCPRDNFKQFADRLEKGKAVSVDRLKSNYKKIAAGQSIDCRSKLFHDFVSYHAKLLETYTTSVDKYFENGGDQPENIEKQYKKELERVGLRAYMIEGIRYRGADNNWLLREFGSLLPKNWKVYLSQLGKEQKEGFTDDDALLISRSEIGQRILFWEKFLLKYPNFIEKDTIRSNLYDFVTVFLLRFATMGQLYGENEEKLRPDIKKAYEEYLKTKSNSIYFTAIKRQYDIIKNNSFIIDNKVRKKLNKNYQEFERQNENIFSREHRSEKLHEYPFVCYDTKTRKSEIKIVYKGCERSYKKCKDIGKLHFGRYSNDLKAHQAFRRCIESNPKFIDSQGL